jgi:hypothetical protein
MPKLVRSAERLRRLSDDTHHVEDGQRTEPLDPALQGLAFEQLHHDEQHAVERVPVIKHLRDMGMVDLRRSHRFMPEALGELRVLRQGWRHQLDGYLGTERQDVVMPADDAFHLAVAGGRGFACS